MKKVCILCPKDVTFNFRKELIEKLLELKFEVLLVSPYGKTIDCFTGKGCRFRECNIDRRGTSIKNDFKLFLQYVKILKQEKPDIVLTYTTKCSVYGGLACEVVNYPYLVNTAGLMQVGNKLSFLERFILFLYKLSFNKASCLFFQNSYEERIVMSKVNKRIRHRLIPGSGVNTEAYSYQTYPAEDKTIIFNYVARVVRIKGIDEFLACASIIKKRYPNVEFVIYGDFDDEFYRQKIEKLEKEQIVKYGGQQEDMKPYITRAHALIHPSYYEGMTNVVLEHSSMGRPCLGSNIPGVKEGIEDGKTGFLFEVRNVDDMVNKVEQFIMLPHLEKEQMGVLARRKMEREFKRDIITNIYIEEINSVVKNA